MTDALIGLAIFTVGIIALGFVVTRPVKRTFPPSKPVYSAPLPAMRPGETVEEFWRRVDDGDV